MEFDGQSLNENSITWNAQRNLREYLKEEIADDATYVEVASQVQSIFNDIFPSRYWLVYAYQNVKGQSINAWDCVSCFAALNVKDKYNIVIASVNKNAVPNTDLIFSPVFDNINDYSN